MPAGGAADDDAMIGDLNLDLETVWNFATALLIGALLGIERERHRQTDGDISVGGLRTFILFALLGALGGWLAALLDFPWILVAVVIATLIAVVASYVMAARLQPDALGLTTELAAVAICLLGATTMLGHRELAVALAVTIAAVLAYKEPLHGMVAQLDREDVYAGVRLLVATFIVLPLLPDRAIDPWGALNPSRLWLLVLLISGLSLVGYVATRLLGADRGIPLMGLTGGLVSSTAVTLSFARQSREKLYAQSAPPLASGILLAWSVMFLRVIVAVLIVNRALLPRLLVPFAVMSVVAAGFAWVMHRRSTVGREAGGVPLKNPFSLTAAAKFAALFAVVMLVVALVQSYSPERGLYFVAALAGTTDVDAITLSMAEYARHGDVNVAVTAIVIAALTNTVIKTVMVVVLGAGGLRIPILAGAAAIVLAGAAALLFG
jgi:uncharacterized membrane protein (DUF4010 family)